MTTADFWTDRRVVYRAYDCDGRLLYVGRTNNLTRRIKEHRTDRWWWAPLVTRLRVELAADHADAKARERDAIQSESPVFNQMGYSDWSDRSRWSPSDRALYARWCADRGLGHLAAVS